MRDRSAGHHDRHAVHQFPAALDAGKGVQEFGRSHGFFLLGSQQHASFLLRSLDFGDVIHPCLLDSGVAEAAMIA